MKFLPLCIALFLYAGIMHAQDIHSSAFGKGIFNITGKDSTWTMKIGARVQILASTTSSLNNDEEVGLVNEDLFYDFNSNFLIRRARLKFNGYALTKNLEYKLELGLSNRDIAGANAFTGNAPRYILDAYMKWKFYKNFQLWFGQFKLPGNRERVISSGNLQFVDRSLVNSNYNLDRDVGIQLRHHFTLGNQFLIREIIAISQGEGRNIVSGNIGGYEYTGRLEFLPFGKFTGKGDYSSSDLEREQTPKLALGVTYDFNNDAVRSRGNQGSFMVYENENGEQEFFKSNVSTFIVDAMFKYKGFSFMGEFASRSANEDAFFLNDTDESPLFTVNTGDGVNLQAGYLFPSNWEIAGRFTTVNSGFNEPILDFDNQYTIGFSRYIVGHKLKVQSDLTFFSIQNADDELAYRLQFDIHF
ncbi:porin [Mangrovimonas aestuarii]|uniref:porin n=1 Tax=Mangrovimonas aestuarii TaxID=3018443 RepID=UPI0023783B57|nr:porin [Mangrovimonas aestuarii]